MITKNFGSCIGSKFNPDGTFRPFCGNTIISSLSDVPINTEISRLQKRLLEGKRGQYLIPLPPESFHMTLFEGVCDQVRDIDHWSSLFPLDAPLANVNERLYKEYLKAPEFPAITMQLTDLRIDGAVSIHVIPVSQREERAIHLYRLAFSSLLGIRFPNHDAYTFHIGLAYGKKRAEADDDLFEIFQQEVEETLQKKPIRFTVPLPSFCTFCDMSHFQPFGG